MVSPIQIAVSPSDRSSGPPEPTTHVLDRYGNPDANLEPPDVDRKGGWAMQSRRFSGLPLIGILAVIYFIAGKLGLMLASLHASASPVWPPAGIALAGLLLLGYRAWPGIFIGAFLVNVMTAGNVATSFAIATGNTLEALVGTWLVNRFAGGTNVFDRPQGVFKFAFAAGISTSISPVFGVTNLGVALPIGQTTARSR